MLCCSCIYLPENRGWGFCFWNNNKNTKYFLLFWGKRELQTCCCIHTVTELARTDSQQCFYQMMWSDTPGKVSHCWSQTHCQSPREEDFFWMSLCPEFRLDFFSFCFVCLINLVNEICFPWNRFFYVFSALSAWGRVMGSQRIEEYSA